MKMAIDTDVAITMRDGVTLSADVWRPDDGQKHPTLVHAPYTDRRLRNSLGLVLNVMTAVERGYAVVLADCRGTWRSGGTWTPFHGHGADGYDCVEWAAAREWCDGNVSVYGNSGMGVTALQTAIAAPPHLKAAFTMLTGGNYHEGWAYRSGVFELAWSLRWARTMTRQNLPRFPDAAKRAQDQPPLMLRDAPKAVRTLPLTDRSLLPADVVPWYYEWVEHPAYDNYWRETDGAARARQIKVPVLQVGGWHDLFFPGHLDLRAALQAHPDARVREGSRFVVGPWTHDTYLGSRSSLNGVRDFGPAADCNAYMTTALALDFFDHHLRGGPAPKPSRYYMMGENAWRDATTWPPASTRLELFLASGGGANTRDGDGRLGPAAEGPDDHFTYDPRHPVPTSGGSSYAAELTPDGVRDQREVELRDDVLVYTSAPLDADLAIAGPVKVVLFAATDGPDTDFTAKLVDVEADGFCANITEGIVRARYRNGLAKEELVSPGATVEYRIALTDTAHRFRAGHRVRLEISSSNFPRYARNLNSAAHPNFGTEADVRTARQTVLHNSACASRLVLPVLQS